MQKDHRKSARETLGTKAWIRFDDGFSVRECQVSDLSRTGVRLVVQHPRTVADRFSLMLKRNSPPGRSCKVKWRRGSAIGAEFV